MQPIFLNFLIISALKRRINLNPLRQMIMILCARFAFKRGSLVLKKKVKIWKVYDNVADKEDRQRTNFDQCLKKRLEIWERGRVFLSLHVPQTFKLRKISIFQHKELWYGEKMYSLHCTFKFLLMVISFVFNKGDI